MSELRTYPPTLIRASAGTGKTFQLTNRLIYLLVAGETPDHILATTFTRKAAGEIFERLLLRLARAAGSESEASALAGHIGFPHFGTSDAQRVLETVIRAQHRLQIATLDSFFARIAKLFALEMGLPVSWEIADVSRENEIRGQALGHLVAKLLKKNDRHVFNEVVTLLGQGGIGKSIVRDLSKITNELYDIYLSSMPTAWDWLPEESLEKIDAQSQCAVFRKLEIPLTQKGLPNANWVKAIDSLIASLSEENPNYTSIATRGIAQSLLNGQETYARAAIPEEFKVAYAPLIKAGRNVVLHELRVRTNALVKLLKLFSTQFEAVKLSQQILLFNDVRRRVLEYGRWDDAQELYFRLDTQIRHLLLDEFQDTSSEEWQIIAPLVDEILADGTNERSFFCVGDVKQAIYGWRGGETALFDHLEQYYKQQLFPIPMDVSYRSAPEIMEVVNRVFHALQENSLFSEYQTVAKYWDTIFRPHDTALKTLPGYVALESLPDSVSAEEARDELDKRVLKKIIELRSEHPTISIAVLYRTNKRIARLIYLLKQHDIEASEEGGNPLTDSSAVTLVLTLLRLLNHPSDTVARFCVANSPIGKRYGFINFNENLQVQNFLDQMRETLSAHGLGIMIRELSEPLWAHLNSYDTERLHQLLEQAFAFQAGAGDLLSSFIDYIAAKRIESPSSAQVRVMTIHQSKGLEFDAVILPELEVKLKGARPPQVVVEREKHIGPITKVCVYQDETKQKLLPELQELFAKNTNARIIESLALLYVAMTRARQALYCFTAPNKNGYGFTFAGVLHSALDPKKEQEANHNTPVYVVGDSNWQKQGEAAPTARVSRIIPQFNFKKSSESFRHFHLSSPSKIPHTDGVLSSFQAVLDPAGVLARERGKALHACFEQIEWIDDVSLDRTIFLDAAAKAIGKRAQLPELIDEFLLLLQNEHIRSFLRKPYRDDCSTVLKRELPFVFRREETLFRGVIDRVTAVKNGSHYTNVHVVDFKSDIFSDVSSEQLEAKAALYRPQIAIYREAAARLFGVEQSQVQASLLFVSPGCGVAV